MIINYNLTVFDSEISGLVRASSLSRIVRRGSLVAIGTVQLWTDSATMAEELMNGIINVLNGSQSETGTNWSCSPLAVVETNKIILMCQSITQIGDPEIVSFVAPITSHDNLLSWQANNINQIIMGVPLKFATLPEAQSFYDAAVAAYTSGTSTDFSPSSWLHVAPV